MNARFGFAKTVSVFALQNCRETLKSRFVAGSFFDDFDLKFVALRPALVSAHQHLRPILRFGSARPGIE